MPRFRSSLSTPLSKSPALSPASPLSKSLRNISTPVTTVLRFSPMPTISISSFTFTTPLSIRPVPTVPRPVIEKTSSTGIKKGLSTSRSGSGIKLSQASISSAIHFVAASSLGAFIAARALPLIIGISSPGKSYSLRRSRSSISTSSNNSGSST